MDNVNSVTPQRGGTTSRETTHQSEFRKFRNSASSALKKPSVTDIPQHQITKNHLLHLLHLLKWRHESSCPFVVIDLNHVFTPWPPQCAIPIFIIDKALVVCQVHNFMLNRLVTADFVMIWSESPTWSFSLDEPLVLQRNQSFVFYTKHTKQRNIRKCF